MARTQDFEQTVAERAKRDPTFARRRSIRLPRSSSTARLILRDLVTATIGFETLGRRDCEAGEEPVEEGNPTMDNLAAALGVLRERLGVDLQAHAAEAV